MKRASPPISIDSRATEGRQRQDERDADRKRGHPGALPRTHMLILDPRQSAGNPDEPLRTERGRSQLPAARSSRSWPKRVTGTHRAWGLLCLTVRAGRANVPGTLAVVESPAPAALGPLAPLVGTWEGSRGFDDSYVYRTGREECAPFRERSTFTAAGPAHNGAQSLYRLDYSTTAWRIGEDQPFHTEIGYWFWDDEHRLVMRGLVTPRGIVILAGGSANPDDTVLTVTAKEGAEDFGILTNPHLKPTARTTEFRVTVDLATPDEFSYDQETYLLQPRTDSPYCHRDRNTLTRVQA